MARRIALLSAALAAAASGQDLCSCSPTSFEFTLDLSGTCDNNTVEDNPGISGSDCSIEALDDGSGQEVGDSGQVVEVFTVEFIEFDNSGDLTPINQDYTYVDVPLSHGDKITFYSRSSMLDTSLSLADQQSNPALVPYGVTLNIYGRTADDNDSFVANYISWYNDMNCGDENNPIAVGDRIGWLTVVSLSLFHVPTSTFLLTLFFSLVALSQSATSNAWPAFCPALPSSGSPTISPRTTEPTTLPSAPKEQDIISKLEELGGYTILLNLIEKAELRDVIKTTKPLTIFGADSLRLFRFIGILNEFSCVHLPQHRRTRPLKSWIGTSSKPLRSCLLNICEMSCCPMRLTLW